MAPITSTYEEGSFVKLPTKGKSFQIFLDKHCTSTRVCIEKKGNIRQLVHSALFFDDSLEYVLEINIFVPKTT